MIWILPFHSAFMACTVLMTMNSELCSELAPRKRKRQQVAFIYIASLLNCCWLRKFLKEQVFIWIPSTREDGRLSLYFWAIAQMQITKFLSLVLSAPRWSRQRCLVNIQDLETAVWKQMLPTGLCSWFLLLTSFRQLLSTYRNKGWFSGGGHMPPRKKTMDLGARI